MGWVDAIVFALVAVYFINLFFFQNFVIPSSSLEKNLLTGDYLFVSKLSYGPRIPHKTPCSPCRPTGHSSTSSTSRFDPDRTRRGPSAPD